MEERCEVCEMFRPEGDLKAGRPLAQVCFGERSVRLCGGHAAIAHNAGVTSLASLRMLYAESVGRRSFIARRGGPVRAGGRRTIDREALPVA